MSLSAKPTGDLLQAHGLRRTPARISLLKVLAAESRPVSVEYLQKKLKNTLDPVTLYRALEAFSKRGILVQFDFGHGHAHYELVHEKPHHHHAVCETCGKIEDVPAYDQTNLVSQALQKIPGFARLDRHSLEFYGQCVPCANYP